MFLKYLVLKTFCKTPGVLCGVFEELDTFYLTVDYRSTESLRLDGGCLAQHAALSRVNTEFTEGC